MVVTTQMINDHTADNLELYAKIFEKPRRYQAGGKLYPPSFIEMEAARALRIVSGLTREGKL
jgi:hypothetical protein